jgi:hypothetical protein
MHKHVFYSKCVMECAFSLRRCTNQTRPGAKETALYLLEERREKEVRLCTYGIEGGKTIL